MKNGLFSMALGSAVKRLQVQVDEDIAEIFTRKIPDTSKAPFDLRDKIGEMAVSRHNVPIPALLKISGPNSEIAHGSSSLVESALLYAHPLVTVASQALVTCGMMGLPGFVATQLAYAVGTLALVGRNWKYSIRPTAQFTLGITALQTAATAFLGSYAQPIVTVGTALMLGRPFLEPFLNNVDGSQRPFALPKDFVEPDDRLDMKQRRTQIEVASDFAKAGPILTIAFASGRGQDISDPHSPDMGLPLSFSSGHDASTHLLIFGATSKGKTYGFIIPIAQQWLTMGTMVNGTFQNCGGMFIIDGKAVLVDDIISALNKQGLDKILKIIKIAPEKDGGRPLALLEGMSPGEITQALSEENETDNEGGSGQFFTGSTRTWLGHGAYLLRAGVDLERIERAEMLQAMDESARAEKDENGNLLGYEDRQHLVDTCIANAMPVPAAYVVPEREFFWHFAALDTMASVWIEDVEFVTGKPPKVAKGMEAPISTAPRKPNGFANWIRKNHPDVINMTGVGKLLLKGLRFIEQTLPAQDERTRSNVRSTMETWLNPVMEHPELVQWAYLEHGCNVLDALTGAVVGIALPTTKYGHAATVISRLAKMRFLNAMKSRPKNWKTNAVECAGHRPVLFIVDECQLVIGRGANTDEAKILSIAREFGLCCLYATQSYDEFTARLGDAAAEAFTNNFLSWATLEASPNTYAWANARMGKQQVIHYSHYLLNEFNKAMALPAYQAHDPAKRAQLMTKLRYRTTFPADVTLSKKDRAALEGGDYSAVSAVRDLGMMFTAGLVSTNLLEVAKGTASMIGGVAKRSFSAVARRSTGVLRAPDDYTPPHFKGEAKIIELFNDEQWARLKVQHTALVSINRANHPRRDIATTVGQLTVRQIRTLAFQQPGVATIYDEMERRGMPLPQAA